jgi:hypothetical protein
MGCIRKKLEVIDDFNDIPSFFLNYHERALLAFILFYEIKYMTWNAGISSSQTVLKIKKKQKSLRFQELGIFLKNSSNLYVYINNDLQS